MSPVFLGVADVVRIHADQVEAYGGSDGVRDERLLESAVSQASATFGGEFLHGGLAAMAAAYLFYIVKNHPFVDGNKRTGLAVALVFLELNGVILDVALTDRLYEATMAAAEGRIRKSELTRLLSDLCREAS